MPFSVGREFLTTSSVPSGWTSTATVPEFALETGISTLVSPAPLGSSMLTVGAVLLLRVASTSTGALTASPFFFASSMALSLSLAAASVLPSLSILTVPVEPLGAVLSVTELPSGLVVVSTLVPSGLVVASGLVVVVLLKPPPPPEEEPPEPPPAEPPEPPPAEPPSGVKRHAPRNTTVVPSKVPLSQPENVHVPVRSPFCALEVEPAVKVVSTASIACSTLR